MYISDTTNSAMLFVFVFILPMTMATIEVHITAGDERTSKVACYGKNVDIINDEDRKNFKVTDDSIKDAILSYYDARPDDVFFHSPTPWNDLYKVHDWIPVTRTITPQKCSLMTVDITSTVVLSEVFNGNKSIEDFQSKITRKIKNSVSSVWEKIGEVSAEHKTVYGFNMIGPGMLGSTQFSYVWKWGRSLENSEILNIGLSKMNVSLNPNITVIAELTMKKAVLKLRVEYEASLSGNLAVNYEQKYRGHHFFAMNVVDVMKSVDLVPSVWSFEVLQLVYHFDSKVTFKNMETNETLYTFALHVI